MAELKLRYWNVNIAQELIRTAWQYHLGTTLDPADTKWFLRGPGNKDVGLYGGLQDTLDSELQFDTNKQTVNTERIFGVSDTMDNRNGLNKLPQSATASLSFTKSSTTTHTKSDSVTVGTSIAASFKAGVPATGVEKTLTVTINFSYTHSFSTSEAETKTQTLTATKVLSAQVPDGKVFRGMIMADQATMKVPYRARIILSGTTQANFNLLVNGKKQHTASAGDLCSWIEQYRNSFVEDGLDVDQSLKFMRHPDDSNKGLLETNGTLTVTDCVNFLSYVVDVTEEFDPKNPKIVQASGEVKDIK